jgi:hypothetical protein
MYGDFKKQVKSEGAENHGSRSMGGHLTHWDVFLVESFSRST